MFGIGFTEILLISIIAILFLGPDKLPETMVQIAKFIKGVKKTVGDAKGALEEEMKIADLKDEALNYKKQLDSATSELRSFKNIDLDDILEDEPTEKKAAKPETQESVSETKVEQKNDVVTFKKKSRKKKEKTSEESTEKIAENTSAKNTSDEKTEKKEGDA